MHELGLAQAIVKQLEAIVRDNKLVRVSKVVVAAGPLSGVQGQFLSDCVASLTKDTPLEGAELVVKKTEMEDYIGPDAPSDEPAPDVSSAMDVYIESVEGDVE